MFQKVLIANRGEIAVRIIKTCKKRNIATVAIYSEADQDALHVKLADEAYLVGGSRVQDSYLQIETIIAIAKQTQVEAIHPGYGLLSENALFATRCEEEGIVFIGPKKESIQAMGDKIQARQTMTNGNIPIVPGCSLSLSSLEEAKKEADNIGYPIMLKAAGGGGGIGMQKIHNETELEKTFASNQARAQNFFGNGKMYMEKYIYPTHHIEVQLLGDQYGNIIHLWERECSIQRRNQKVIEEAPSPLLDENTRQKLCETAVQAAKVINYENAGTIEFLVDSEKNFYFLEMNTRIQVEHPVTECITGIDIVEEQLKIASGQRLSWEQAQIKKQGYAIEARLYAENPLTFYPSPGTISTLTLPTEIRIDHYLQSNMKVTPFYDPMLGKIIAYGTSRQEAITQLEKALQQLKVEGIHTNAPLLIEVIQSNLFQQGIYDTSFIETLRQK